LLRPIISTRETFLKEADRLGDQGDKKMIPEFILYSDFTNPFCYALEQRLRELRVSDRVAWRGVHLNRTHQVGSPVPSGLGETTQPTDLAYEVGLVRQAWPDLPIAVPTIRSDPGDANRAMAAFLLIDDVQARAFKHACYQAFWRKGWDLSDRSVLATLARGVKLAPTAVDLLDHPHIAATAALWQRQWEETGVRTLPLLIRRDGTMLAGLADRSRIDRFLEGDVQDRT
jgi:predicted DsbA family dithiol-disulfide isomerase